MKKTLSVLMLSAIASNVLAEPTKKLLEVNSKDISTGTKASTVVAVGTMTGLIGGFSTIAAAGTLDAKLGRTHLVNVLFGVGFGTFAVNMFVGTFAVNASANAENQTSRELIEEYALLKRMIILQAGSKEEIKDQSLMIALDKLEVHGDNYFQTKAKYLAKAIKSIEKFTFVNPDLDAKKPSFKHGGIQSLKDLKGKDVEFLKKLSKELGSEFVNANKTILLNFLILNYMQDNKELFAPVSLPSV